MNAKCWFGSLITTCNMIIIIIFTALILLSCSKDKSNPVAPPSQQTGTVSDIDGNIYQTIKIGTQWWMAENLRVIHYRNGDAIPNITDNTTWEHLPTGAYCKYNNDEITAAVYGHLYNWYAVHDSRNIAPSGWHVPTADDWQKLVTYLGGEAVAGGKMKEAGTSHWGSPNTGATNESGFTALPGGHRFSDYWNLKYYADFWSSTISSNNRAWSRTLGSVFTRIDQGDFVASAGFSVRCVKD